MAQERSHFCPACDTKGQRVGNATIKCLVSVSLHRIEDVIYRFCANSDCTVVYFAEDGSNRFHIEDLRERVYQKEPNAPDILVCYCFFRTLGDIQTSLTDDGKSPIVDDINFGIQQGHCACDWRNPQGNCCLGNVIKIVKAHAN